MSPALEVVPSATVANQVVWPATLGSMVRLHAYVGRMLVPGPTNWLVVPLSPDISVQVQVAPLSVLVPVQMPASSRVEVVFCSSAITATTLIVEPLLLLSTSSWMGWTAEKV